MKIYKSKNIISSIFNRKGKWFFVTENCKLYCIDNEKIKYICKMPYQIHHIKWRIINDKNGFTIFYNFYFNSRDFYIHIDDNLYVKKGRANENHEKEEWIREDYNDEYATLFSNFPHTKSLLKRFFNYNLDDEFKGLILVKKFGTIKFIPMPYNINVVKFSQDSCTLAIVVANEIYLIDLDE